MKLTKVRLNLLRAAPLANPSQDHVISHWIERTLGRKAAITDVGAALQQVEPAWHLAVVTFERVWLFAVHDTFSVSQT